MPPKSLDASGVPLQKQRFNIYTMMMILSFIAITTACILLWSELADYMRDPQTNRTIWPPWDASAAKFTPPVGP